MHVKRTKKEVSFGSILQISTPMGLEPTIFAISHEKAGKQRLTIRPFSSISLDSKKYD